MEKYLLLLLIPFNAYAETEQYYSDMFCEKMGGVTEVVLPDRTRVDCYTADYVIEVDFAKKWYEGVGQSLHYATVTGKKPAVALIMGDKDQRFMDRAKRLTVCPEITFYRIHKI